MIVTLNIGLDVKGVEPSNQLNKTLSEVTKLFPAIFNIKVDESIRDNSNWEKERVLVISVFSEATDKNVLNNQLIYMSALLEQDAIAYVIVGVSGHLAFNPNYEGKHYRFNNKFFKTI